MKGTISLESKEGVGSEFSIIFKELEVVNSWKNTENFSRLAHIKFKGQLVLIVEDIKSNVDIVKGFLEGLNIEILVAENGQIAIDMLENIKPDLILMDMMMPVMSGYTATKIIKSNERLAGVPIIATTASALKHNELLISNVCDNYIRKPIAKDELIEMLASYLSYTEVQLINNEEDFMNEDIYDLPMDLRIDLDKKFRKKFNAINELMSIDDISSFASEIKEYGEKMNDTLLNNYGEKLLDFADNFEIDKMNALFKNFTYLMQERDNA